MGPEFWIVHTDCKTSAQIQQKACVIFNMEKLPRLGVLHWLQLKYQLCLRVEIQTIALEKFKTKPNYTDQNTKAHLSCVSRAGNQCLATSYSFPESSTLWKELISASSLYIWITVMLRVVRIPDIPQALEKYFQCPFHGHRRVNALCSQAIFFSCTHS